MTQVQTQILGTKVLEEVARPAPGDTALNRLLSLYPNAKAVRIPVQVQLPPRGKGARERTMIAFKTHDAAIFSMKYALRGGEMVLMHHAVEPDAASAVTVAMIPDGFGWAVAVRFIEGTPRWILKS